MQDKIIEIKKKKVIEVVLRVCAKRGLPKPYINFDGCSEEDDDQLAHYHPDSNTICISEYQLNRQNLDEIETTTTHELAHIYEYNHDVGFRDEEALNNIANFKPGAGVIHITPNSSKNLSEKKDKIVYSKKQCNKNGCNKRKNLKKCPYCKKMYCPEHIKAVVPSMFLTENYTREEDNHACPDYAEFLYNEEQKRKTTYPYSRIKNKSKDYDLPDVPGRRLSEKELHNLTSRYLSSKTDLTKTKNVKVKRKKGKSEKKIKKRAKQQSIRSYTIPEKHKKEDVTDVINARKEKQKASSAWVSIIIAILIISTIVYLDFSNRIPTEVVPLTLNCSDGTNNNKCSNNKPFFCRNGSLEEKPTICGCPEGKRLYSNNCIDKVQCVDGTLEPDCSTTKPYQCIKGSLISKASVCGCPDNQIIKAESCI
jgi:hypothetical protein